MRTAAEIAQYVSLRSSGLSTTEVARALGVTRGVAAGVLYRHDHPRPSRPAGSQRGELNHHAKLSRADVLAIRDKLARGAIGKALATEYSIHPSTVCLIKKGKRWPHLSEAA